MKSLRTFLSWAFVAAVAVAMGSLSVSLMSPPARAASYFSGGTGNVSGPASSTDNAIVRWDGTTGRTTQNSTATIDDSGNLTVNGTITSSTVTTSSAVNAGSMAIAGGGSFLINSGSNGGRIYPGGLAGIFRFVDTSATGGAIFESIEIADPAAPAANEGRLYFRDNGSGKTQLVVRFNTGAVQVLATEP